MTGQTDSKEKIIQAATNLFYENSYELTATKEIAKEAGVSEALVFKYFKNKQNLLNVVLEEVIDEFQVNSYHALSCIYNSPISASEKLSKFLEDRETFITTHYKTIAIILSQMQHSAKIKARIESILANKVTPMIRKLMEGYFEENNLESKKLTVACALFKGLLIELLINTAIINTSNNNALIPMKLTIILKGLQNE